MGRIIIARHEMPVPVIELAPLGVNYDLTAEELIVGLLDNNHEITSEHFPKPPTEKTGVVEENLCLVRPMPTGQYFSDEQVEETVTKAGYAFEEWPSLGPLKEYADELWNAGIQYIVARGPNSRWRRPRPLVGSSVVYFVLRPGARRFLLLWLPRGFDDHGWFLCRKSQPSEA